MSVTGRRPNGDSLRLPIEGEGSWDHLLELVRIAPDDMTWTYTCTWEGTE